MEVVGVVHPQDLWIEARLPHPSDQQARVVLGILHQEEAERLRPLGHATALTLPTVLAAPCDQPVQPCCRSGAVNGRRWFVQNQPVHPQPGDRVDEIPEVDGFADVAVGPQ